MSRSAPAPTFTGDGKIVMLDRDYPEPGPGQLLINVRANAICGTDRDQYFSGSDVIPGHEAAGVVEAVGPEAQIAVGTPGVVFLMDYCGVCRSCSLGHTNQCLAKRADMGFTADGGYGPYEIVHESNFFAVPPELSPAEATLLLDVMGTSSHAIGRVSLVRRDIESVYIAGAGPIGLGLLVMAKLRLGADIPVYVSDLSPWRRDYAAGLGAIAIDAADLESPTTAVPEADVAFDSTGKESARRGALRVLGKRGVLACVGHGQGLTLDVSDDLIAPERTVMGSEYFRYDEIAGNVELLLAHREQLGRVITHTFPVDQIGDAFATFLAGESGKVVVTQDGA